VAGIVPALIMAAFFVGYIVIRCLLDPSLAPSEDVSQLSLRERVVPFLVYVLPLSIIFLSVVGSLLLGIATPTESAALGVLAALATAMGYRALTWQNLVTSLRETAKTSVMILFIIVASITFSQVLAFSGATRGFIQLVEGLGLSPFTVLLGMMAMLLALGCFIDQVSMVMITVPLFIPLADLVGIDLVWLGVIYLLTMEISFLTPPFGLLLFVMKGVAPPEITMARIYRAALPFLILELTVLGLVMIWPGLGTWLPSVIEP
jgi:tripartite ATP-independent transporter DctM subunit